MMELPCQSPSPAASDFSEGFGFDHNTEIVNTVHPSKTFIKPSRNSRSFSNLHQAKIARTEETTCRGEESESEVVISSPEHIQVKAESCLKELRMGRPFTRTR